MTQWSNVSSPTSLERALKEDHARLEGTFHRVQGAFRRHDLDAIRSAWLELEAELEEHMKVEEQLILPKFSTSFPREAKRIERDHKEIRAELVQLGIHLDLHELPESAAARFIHALEQHAAFEEQALYGWAQAHLSEGEQRSVFDRLRAAIGLKRPTAQAPTAQPRVQR